ncbi:MAG TPA: HEAT repeat domain-containing protein [Fimbriiglobus sp.]|nr:HEAT repeat domain-containing protein [Fimbriiglobus sp.]
MARLIAMIALVAAGSGCASTWETMTSRRFRDKPFETMFGTEDPLTVLRQDPDGEARAKAMRRLKEPAANGRPQAEQDEVMQILSTAATSDPSPWVRMAAIDALGKFQDSRTVETLAAAYYQASGRTEPEAQPAPVVVTAGGRTPGVPVERFGLHGPQGFPSDQAANIRGRALEALARTGRPEAVEFLARVAGGQELPANDDPAAAEFVRQRAVAGLGQVRSKEAVRALARVLAAEHGKDVTLTHLAHGGLVSLTGQDHPADPQEWNAVVQAGFEIAPE